MSLSDRLAVALPKLIFALLLTVATTLACSTFFFYAFDLIMGTTFFAQSPLWIPVAGIISWLFLGATVLALRHEYKRPRPDEGLETLASIMMKQEREERDPRPLLAQNYNIG